MWGLRKYHLEGGDGHRGCVTRRVYNDEVDKNSSVGTICDQYNMTSEKYQI